MEQVKKNGMIRGMVAGHQREFPGTQKDSLVEDYHCLLDRAGGVIDDTSGPFDHTQYIQYLADKWDGSHDLLKATVSLGLASESVEQLMQRVSDVCDEFKCSQYLKALCTVCPLVIHTIRHSTTINVYDKFAAITMIRNVMYMILRKIKLPNNQKVRFCETVLGTGDAEDLKYEIRDSATVWYAMNCIRNINDGFGKLLITPRHWAKFPDGITPDYSTVGGVLGFALGYYTLPPDYK